MTKRILIITGGISSERRISFMSARAVKKALLELGFKVKLVDLKHGYKQIRKLAKSHDVIFPVIHGEEGEGGKLQKFLSTLGKPFIGGDHQGYKKSWYKIPFKKFCAKNNIPTAKWKKVKNREEIIQFGFPCVLKSDNGGSSKEVVILKSKKDLNKYLVRKLLQKQKLFVEHFIPGVEITVAVLHQKALPVIEIIPPKGSWFDYKNKYWGRTKEIPFAPSIPLDIQQKVQKIAEFIHQTFNLGQFSRTDFIISKGGIYTLEVNTIPGLTSSSLFPKAALADGISFPQLLDKIIRLAYFK